jgi:hypothetical protein
MLFIAAFALVAAGAAMADPPARVARLTQLSGTITFSPAGEDEWAFAQANRPIISGDRLWADTASHAELQIGSAALRLGNQTSVEVLTLDDVTAQVQLAQGTLNLHVRRVYADQVFEVDTPNLAFSVRRPGDYRIDVDPAGNTTVLRVRSGEGEAWGENAAYIIGAGQQYTFVGEGLRDYSTDALSPPDAFDQWAFERDRREEAAVSASFVPPDLVGSSDLDQYGSWRNVEGYGNVWVPTSVVAGWSPYHYGRWAWIEPWGWTWIDDAPWGFAPFHYGRWAYLSNRWCWVPGPVAVRPVYAPALVAFVGGNGFSLTLASGAVAGVAWFPLGVGEVYRPAYTVSRNYFTNVNVTNTVVNTTVINNYYNNVNVTNVVYRNREVAGAVTAVPATAFASGRPVAASSVHVAPEAVTRAPVATVAPVTPSRASLIAAGAVGAAAVAAVAKPSTATLSRRFVAKTPPPPVSPSFAARSQLLAEQPGKPPEADKLNTLRAQKTAERNVKVVGPTTPGAAQVKPVPLAKQRGPGPEGSAPKERAARDERQAPAPSAGPPPTSATSNVPRPPQERMPREDKREASPQGSPPPQAQERGTREEKRGPPPQAGTVSQPQQQERTVKEERRGPPQAAPAPQPPQQQDRAAREERRPPPQAAPAPQSSPQQDRALKEERRGPSQAGPVPQPPQQQERKEERRVPPPQQAQASQAGAKAEQRREEPRQGKDKEREEKDKKDKENRAQ